MKFTNTLTLALFALCLIPVTDSYAGKAPKAGSKDARVKTITYNDNEVFAVRAHYGFSTAIEFSEREKIETISMGDSEAWQVMKPNRPNILFIKPLDENAATNMTVLTTQRVYSFILTADNAESHKSGALTFRLKFRYPNDQRNSLVRNSSTDGFHDPMRYSEPTALNFDYSYSGSNRLKPIRAFDDGTFTYFQFNDFEVMPAIFAVDEKGNERLVNYNVQGKYLVVSSIYRQFTLRDGDTATCIFNEDHPAPKEEHVENIIPVAKLEPKTSFHSSGIPIPSQKPRFNAASDESFFAIIASRLEPTKSENLNN